MRDHKLKSRAVGLCAVLLLALIAIGGDIACGQHRSDAADYDQCEQQYGTEADCS